MSNGLISVLTEDQVKDVQTIIKQMLAATAGDKKITQLDAIPSIHDNDLLPIVDDTDTTTKKCTAAQLKTHIQTVGDKDVFIISVVPTTSFPLSNIPGGDDSTGVFRNGRLQPPGAYNIVGSTLNWLGPQLQLGEEIIVWYDWQAPVFGLYKGTYAGTMPAVGFNLKVTAAQLGLTSARQIVIPRLMVKLGGVVNSWTPDGNNVQNPQTLCDIFIPAAGHVDDGDLYISTGIGATLVAGQPFEFIYLYQSTNFLS